MIEDITKINRSQFWTYLDTTPAGENRTWAKLGVGITDYGIAYNPQVDQEKWIIEDNARSDHSSNQKQGAVAQKMYKGDPCFEFANKGLDKLNYKTNILDIDAWNGDTNDIYPAKQSAGKLVPTQYMNDTATIEYTLYYEGDPVEGWVTITNGAPVFTTTKPTALN